jgi:gluconate 2-dehydrogenase alpha chain
MATTLKNRTVVVIGGGLTAGFVSRQLVAQGHDVLVLERGFDHRGGSEQTIPNQRDELRWYVRGGLFQDLGRETYTSATQRVTLHFRRARCRPFS